MEHLKRHNSVCVDPQDALLKAVIQNDLFEIERVVKENPGILSERYKEKYLKPILYIAIKDKADIVTTNTINYLIEEGAPLNYIDPKWQAYEAIHFAALGQNPLILKCIIKNYHEKLMDISVAAKNGSTALHVLIKEGDPKREGFEDCVRILLENRIDYNKTDNNNSPPIYWAAKKKYKNIVTLMLSYPDLDLDTYRFRDKTARVFIKELNIADVTDLPEETNQEHNNNNMLLSYIKQGMEKKFIDLANALDTIDDSMSEKSFLQYACDKYLLEVVKYLISKGVDKNRISKKHDMSPIEIAAWHGYHLILELLINQSDTYVSNNVLLYILPRSDYDITEKVNYKRCFDLVISSNKSINVNHKDKNGNYPLHYAARYGGTDTVLSLLAKKASLANRNAFDTLNINEIDYSTLKQHFDNCIEAIPDNRLDKESMTVTFDYETLLPTKTDIAVTKEYDEENNLCKKVYATPETDAVLFMSKSSELKTLLKHPLITSFLYVKWYRIRWIFYTNFIFYLTFLASLLLYIFAYYKEPDEQRNTILFIFLFITTCVLLVREVFQVVVGPKKYFSNFENFIEISLICFVAFMLFEPNTSPDIKTQAAAFAFLLAAFELLFLLGNYPGLSTNIVMLRTVSLNFFKFLCFYSILIIAFAFCFHTLFKPHETSVVPNNSTDLQVEEEEEKDKFFVNPVIAMFKTIVMLTGEFDAGDLEFENYPVTSHLIFLAFVMTIAIILLNLLNGLAVSDTQEIKNEAELVGHIARAEYIAYAESMFFSSFIPRKLTNWYYTLFPCQEGSKFKKLVSKPLTQKICIYPEYLTGYKLEIYPNQGGRVHFEDEKNETCKCRNLYLDKVTVRRSRVLLQEKKEREKEENERQKLIKMQADILEKVNELLATIGR